MRLLLLASALALFLLPLAPAAETPEQDEKRIEELIRERYGPTQEEIDALALQGLGPDGQPLIDPATGLPITIVPVDPNAAVAMPAEAVAASAPGSAATPATAPVVPDLPPVGPITFEDLAKLTGQWVKLRTYSGRVWQGEVVKVKGAEVQINVQQRGGGALMTLKKPSIASLERI